MTTLLHHAMLQDSSALSLVEDGPAEDAAHLTAGYLTCHTLYGDAVTGLIWDEARVMVFQSRELSKEEEAFLSEVGFTVLHYGGA